MMIYPAIDCRKGHCVRLYQGDYQQETIYGDLPIDMAKTFVAEGASWLHLIDLDGAKNPSSNQSALIETLIRSTSLFVQVGGGIRTFEQVEAYLESGAIRVVIGSLAVIAPETVLGWLQQLGGERLVLAFDVVLDGKNHPKVATHAWQKISSYNLYELIARYEMQGLKHVLCTDISKDGTLEGPNMALYEGLLKHFPGLQIQASGGIHALENFKQLKEIGVAGAIIGRALYEKQFSLREALSC
jgi:phosphoribosylformimino-5-aminoimidazole carboxamide ribotide isomerase